MDGSNQSWAHPLQRTPAALGWRTYESSDAPPLTASKNWLATPAPALTPSQALPTARHPWESPDSIHGNTTMRLRNIKRNIMRRMTSWTRSRLGGSDTLTRPGSSPSALPPTMIPSASTVRFVLLCALWYTSSALSSNTGKVILTQFKYPITLTFVQFGFVALYCLFFMSPIVRFSTFKPPTKAILSSTFPMGCFQVGGHIFSSMAISRIHVSTVHTIKALSPLFTVAAYALLFGVRYSPKTYISLLPLTVGVILACSSDFSASNIVGLLCAFGSAIIFVSSNIFFKKVVPSGSGASAASSHKLDKLNLLFYSSSMAFVLMIPIWAYYDLPALLALTRDPSYIVHPAHEGHSAHHSVTRHVFANGSVHFAQNIIAFILLAQTSPVTYSIASLIKRVAVICIAIVWFAQPVHALQAFGIALTFGGLYMYNQAKGDVEKGERSMRRVAAARALELPSNRSEITPSSTPPPVLPVDSNTDFGVSSGYGRPQAQPTAAAYTSSMPPHTQGPPPSGPHHTQPIYPHRPSHPRTYSQTHNAPNLRIKITPPSSAASAKPASPVDLYPSPPPSLDSPPLDSNASPWPAAPNGHQNPSASTKRRGSMVTGHGLPRHHESSAPRAALAM